jgi:murein DD-endopeptidase MepM/ murein hydrolase activator NlpD
LISRKKRYKFDTGTLTFIEVKTPFGKNLKNLFLYFLSISAFAFLIVFVAKAILNSSKLNTQAINLRNEVQKYEGLSKQADRLAEILKTNHYNQDKVYREILEMDSLPEDIRTAGTGGYSPYENVSFTYSDEVFTGLMMKFDKIKSQIKIQDESYDKILFQALNRNKKLDCYPGIPPLDPRNLISISSHFGSRDDPFTFKISQHPGIDFTGELNTKVYATAKGTVELAESSFTGYGNEIIIDHGFGYKTRFGHLNKILVQKGQKIKRGQLIGLMGNTGRSTGTHLHYEVRFYDKPVNPVYFYSDNISTEEYEKLTK